MPASTLVGLRLKARINGEPVKLETDLHQSSQLYRTNSKILRIPSKNKVVLSLTSQSRAAVFAAN
jgi:hypothetical protein